MKCEGFHGPCGKYKAVKVRMRTFYQNEADNYKVLCPECQEESREHWDEMWAEYYSMVL